MEKERAVKHDLSCNLHSDSFPHSRIQLPEGEVALVVTGDNVLVHNNKVVERAYQLLLNQQLAIEGVQVQTRCTNDRLKEKQQHKNNTGNEIHRKKTTYAIVEDT